jgi:hypothetical protein
MYYAIELFLSELPVVISNRLKMSICVRNILRSIGSGDEIVRNALLSRIHSLPQSLQDRFKEVVKEITQGVNPPIYLKNSSLFSELFDDDDVPF